MSGLKEADHTLGSHVTFQPTGAPYQQQAQQSYAAAAQAAQHQQQQPQPAVFNNTGAPHPAFDSWSNAKKHELAHQQHLSLQQGHGPIEGAHVNNPNQKGAHTRYESITSTHATGFDSLVTSSLSATHIAGPVANPLTVVPPGKENEVAIKETEEYLAFEKDYRTKGMPLDKFAYATSKDDVWALREGSNEPTEAWHLHTNVVHFFNMAIGNSTGVRLGGVTLRLHVHHVYSKPGVINTTHFFRYHASRSLDHYQAVKVNIGYTLVDESKPGQHVGEHRHIKLERIIESTFEQAKVDLDGLVLNFLNALLNQHRERPSLLTAPLGRISSFSSAHSHAPAAAPVAAPAPVATVSSSSGKKGVF